MKTSVVIRSRDEAPRLRLTLAALEAQPACDEIVVVDDGSVDDSAQVIAAAGVRSVRHERSKGRAAASNAGAEAARGDVLIFLDGDTLAGPGFVAAHAAAHAADDRLIGRGETWHLRCTRFLADPETGRFWPHEAARTQTLGAKERDAMRVTLAQVRTDFASIARRAQPGIYAGAAPRRQYEAEMAALRRPDAAQLWAAASGSNLSVRRDSFLNAGGFDPAIDINEHRELAWRLCGAGARMAAVDGAHSYHLTHRSGWRDPLRDDGWERVFRRAHPHAPIDALKAFWRALSSNAPAADFFAR